MHALTYFLIASFLVPLPAQAQPIEPGKEGELARFVAPEPDNRICYARSYPEDHLKAHPKQRVTAMRFRLIYYAHEPQEDLPKGQRNYYFQLMAKLSGDAREKTAFGECVPNGDAISCGVECDGGGIRVRRRGSDQVLVDFGDGDGGRIRMTEGCDGEESAVDLEPGADDREFLLSKLPDAECPIFEEW